MLPKRYRLKHRAAFRIVFKHGLRARDEHGMLIGLGIDSENFPKLYSEISERASTKIRFGFVISKKIGKAYYRNKFKRVLSSIVYEFMHEGGLESLEKMSKVDGKIILVLYVAFKTYGEFSLLKSEVLDQLRELVRKLTQRT